MLKSSALLQRSQLRLRFHVDVFNTLPVNNYIQCSESDIKWNFLFNVGVLKKQSKCLKSKQDRGNIWKHQPLKQDDSQYF